MRISYLLAVLGLQAIHFVAAHDEDESPARPSAAKKCGCKKHGPSAVLQAIANPSTFATVIVSSHRCSGTHHMEAPSITPADLPAAAAPTVVQAPVVDPSLISPPEAVISQAASESPAPSDATLPSASASPDLQISVAASSLPSPDPQLSLSSDVQASMIASAIPDFVASVDSAPSAAASSEAVSIALVPSEAVPSEVPASAVVPAASSVQPQVQNVASSVPSTVPAVSNAALGLTAEQIIAIMPSSSSCTSATPAGECLAAAQAAPLLSQSFTKYGLNNKGVQAAAIALIALESGEMKYIQHYNGASPARTGQGTYNEMSPSFVVEFGKSLYGSGAPSDPVAAMDKINSSPGDSIASAAWFIQAHCGASLISQFATDPEQAWSAYITACIFTPMTDARRQYWNKAKAALGV